MRFGQGTHECCAGADLHTKTMYVCVLDQAGGTLVHRNIKAEPEPFLRLVSPFREDLVVAAECTFSWYWLADLCAEESIQFVLGHALYMKAIHGGKVKNDKDSAKIAGLLRGGLLPHAYVCPARMRGTRDLLRRRTAIVRKRAEALAHVQNTNSQRAWLSTCEDHATSLGSLVMEADLSEERVFIDLIEDILRATPGLHYQADIRDPSERDQDDGAYAVFMIETNPGYQLEVSIKLSEDGFQLRVNEEEFSHRLESRRRIDRWIERRCRDVEQLVKGDLKVEVEVIFGRYLSSGLFAGSDDHWIEIADRDEGWGWIGLAAWLLPFGLSPLKSHETEYRGWFEVH